ncbi:MAG: DUF86 domain-containing protein [Flavobacteriales bacterium]|nr:DUF86 domain-containing protein [Flavobacteriales bacterium]
MDVAKKYWSDVLSAIEEIDAFTGDIDGMNGHLADRRTKWAAERGLAITGEAIHHLRRLGAEGLPPDADRIVAMRNRLIHSYDNVDDKIVWHVIKVHLPALKAAAVGKLQDPTVE